MKRISELLVKLKETEEKLRKSEGKIQMLKSENSKVRACNEKLTKMTEKNYINIESEIRLIDYLQPKPIRLIQIRNRKTLHIKSEDSRHLIKLMVSNFHFLKIEPVRKWITKINQLQIEFLHKKYGNSIANLNDCGWEPIPTNCTLAKKDLYPFLRTKFMDEFISFKKDKKTDFDPNEWILIDKLFENLDLQRASNEFGANSLKRAAMAVDIPYHQAIILLHRLPKHYFHGYAINQCPVLKNTDYTGRLAMAHRLLDQNFDIKKIIFSDESSVRQYAHVGNLKCYTSRDKKPTPIPTTNGQGFSVMIWAAIGFSYKSSLILLQKEKRIQRGPRAGQIDYESVGITKENYQSLVLEPFKADLKSKGFIRETEDGSVLKNKIFQQVF